MRSNKSQKIPAPLEDQAREYFLFGFAAVVLLVNEAARRATFSKTYRTLPFPIRDLSHHFFDAFALDLVRTAKFSDTLPDIPIPCTVTRHQCSSCIICHGINDHERNMQKRFIDFLVSAAAFISREDSSSAPSETRGGDMEERLSFVNPALADFKAILAAHDLDAVQ